MPDEILLQCENKFKEIIQRLEKVKGDPPAFEAIYEELKKIKKQVNQLCFTSRDPDQIKSRRDFWHLIDDYMEKLDFPLWKKQIALQNIKNKFKKIDNYEAFRITFDELQDLRNGLNALIHAAIKSKNFVLQEKREAALRALNIYVKKMDFTYREKTIQFKELKRKIEGANNQEAYQEAMEEFYQFRDQVYALGHNGKNAKKASQVKRQALVAEVKNYTTELQILQWQEKIETVFVKMGKKLMPASFDKLDVPCWKKKIEFEVLQKKFDHVKHGSPIFYQLCKELNHIEIKIETLIHNAKRHNNVVKLEHRQNLLGHINDYKQKVIYYWLYKKTFDEVKTIFEGNIDNVTKLRLTELRLQNLITRVDTLAQTLLKNKKIDQAQKYQDLLKDIVVYQESIDFLCFKQKIKFKEVQQQFERQDEVHNYQKFYKKLQEIGSQVSKLTLEAEQQKEHPFAKIRRALLGQIQQYDAVLRKKKHSVVTYSGIVPLDPVHLRLLARQSGELGKITFNGLRNTKEWTKTVALVKTPYWVTRAYTGADWLTRFSALSGRAGLWTEDMLIRQNEFVHSWLNYYQDTHPVNNYIVDTVRLMDDSLTENGVGLSQFVVNTVSLPAQGQERAYRIWQHIVDRDIPEALGLEGDGVWIYHAAKAVRVNDVIDLAQQQWKNKKNTHLNHAYFNSPLSADPDIRQQLQDLGVLVPIPFSLTQDDGQRTKKTLAQK